MDPATTRRGLQLREGIDNSTTHHAAMEIETEQGTKPCSKGALIPEPIQTAPKDPAHLRHPPQSSVYGLRHNDASDVNMPTAYERMQAYKPPEYVSPYGRPQSNPPGTNAVNNHPVRQSHSPRLTPEEDPPWMCCFSQNNIPEWIRHTEKWNPGSAGACTAYACKHKKCADCLWESLEETPGGVQFRSHPPPREMDTRNLEQSDFVAYEEAADEDLDSMDRPMMAPPGMPASRGIHRDPKTGRPRLWTKN